MTAAPAGLLGLGLGPSASTTTAATAGTVATTSGGAGRLLVGGVADLCVFAPESEWQVTPDALRSQGKHTPFAGYALRGRVLATLVDGRLVHG